MKVIFHKSGYVGSLPEPGELFMVPKGEAIYMRVSEDHKLLDDKERQDGHILGISLESGTLRWIPINTTRRHGFKILVPAGGKLEVQGVQK
jgi:hypothetical protein